MTGSQDPNAVADAIEARSKGLPSAIADKMPHEVRQAANYFARAAYRAAGCAELRWMASPACSAECQALDGQVVSIDQPFAADPPRHHPPLAEGCKCGIAGLGNAVDLANRADGETRGGPGSGPRPRSNPDPGLSPSAKHRPGKAQKYRLVDPAEAARLKKKPASTCRDAFMRPANRRSIILEPRPGQEVAKSWQSPIPASSWRKPRAIRTITFSTRSGSTATFSWSRKYGSANVPAASLPFKSMHKVAAPAAGAATP